MYAGKTFSMANTMSNATHGLKVTTNLKAGAAATNPSLLNANQMVVGDFKVRTTVMVGARPCTTILYSV